MGNTADGEAPTKRGPGPLWAVPWQRDADAPCCTSCRVGFGVLTRRHHCRACGLVFCQLCSAQSVHGERACQACFRRVMRALSEECLKPQGPGPPGVSLRPLAALALAAPPMAPMRTRAKARLLPSPPGPAARPALLVATLSSRNGGRYPYRAPQPHRPPPRDMGPAQAPQAGAGLWAGRPGGSPNASLASEDVTLGHSAGSSHLSSRDLTPAFACDETMYISDLSQPKLRHSYSSEEELDAIYCTFLQKEHSQRATKLLTDQFIHYGLTLPAPLQRLGPL